MSLTYQSGELFCEEVAVSEIAQQIGTPFYLYSAARLRRNFADYKTAFAGSNVTICFAVKSCSNIALLKLLTAEGAGAETVSGGEIERALRAEIYPEKIIFSGVGKTKEEITFALDSRIGQLNVESLEELELISRIATARQQKAHISLRVNPDVDAETHEKITTGRKSDKFGIPWNNAMDAYKIAKSLPSLQVEGIACHIGSQIIARGPFRRAFAKIANLTRELAANGIPLQRIDLGGGLGVRYKDESVISVSEYADLIREVLYSLGTKLFLEPGRSISASAGALIAQVQFIKHAEGKTFAILDAGMNDLVRPAIYDAYHEILAVRPLPQSETYEVVGPVCESADVFAKERTLSQLAPGALLAIINAGAYGAAMASNYNTRPLPPEVLVEGENFKIIRSRQTFADIIALEHF